MPVTFTLRLGDDGSPDHRKRYNRLPPPVSEKPYQLRFVLNAGSRATKHSFLVTNYAKGEFHREKFVKIPFEHDELSDAVCTLSIDKPGCFHYHVEYRDDNSNAPCNSHHGSFVVDPRLYVPKTIQDSTDKVILPLDGIVIITVIPKWLPVIDSWEPFFKAFAEGGYNMVHFAPVNQRGISNSPYALYDQLMLSDDLFKDFDLSESAKEEILQAELDSIKTKYGILSVTDVVWNHTACNSLWLEDHPEAGYNLKNSPHLRSAYELDEAIMQFSHDVVHMYERSPVLKTDQELDDYMQLWREKAFPNLKLWEFYVINVEECVQKFSEHWQNYKSLKNIQLPADFKEQADFLKRHALIEANLGHRYGKTINISDALEIIDSINSSNPIELFRRLVNEINLGFYQEYDYDSFCIHEQIKNRAKFLRVSDHGPKLGPVSRDNPLVDTYFTRLPLNERTEKFHSDELKLANNGWIWNADPLVNFAAPKSKAYLRRDVIAWGDCVKLRYGDGPQDNPWLWSHMTQYTRKMAKMFDGFRIDNCHSTPIHVASYLLDVGRRVKPDLYVFAELFTGSEDKDILFVSTLGINSLIRESMNAWDAAELSRLVHRHGGQPVGSLTITPEYFPLNMLGHKTVWNSYNEANQQFENEFGHSLRQPMKDTAITLTGSSPHALFMDCTHDNETPHQKRTADDSLPNAAVVAMSHCAMGSVKGYDEIVPELLNVVSETRKYRVPDRREGIIVAKTILQQLHVKMAQEGYSEIYVHQENDYISIHRVHPVTHDGFLLIARHAFKNKSSDSHSPLVLKNQNVQLIQSATLKVNAAPTASSFSAFNSPAMHATVFPDVPSLSLNSSAPSSPVMHPIIDPHALVDSISEFSIDDQGDRLSVRSNSITSPTALYHHMGLVPEVSEAKLAAKKLKQKAKQKHFGVISGLASLLEFSTSETALVDIKTDLIGPNHSETIISIDQEWFEPGSIVLFRTSVVGSGMDTAEDWVDSSKIVPDRLNTPPPLRMFLKHPGDLHKVQVTPSYQHSLQDSLLKAPIDYRKFGLGIAEHSAIVSLWTLLGMNGNGPVVHLDLAIEFMVRMAFDNLDSGQLWFQKHNWLPGLREAIKEIGPEELNVALYRVDEEENDTLRGHGTYEIPGYGKLAYCGLQGFISVLLPAASSNDLGHPVFKNLREGTWMMDYIINRLDKYIVGYKKLQGIRDWMHERFELIRKLSSSFVPKYFSMVVFYAYQALRFRGIEIACLNEAATDFICPDLTTKRTSSLEAFVQSLVMTSYQFYGRVHSTGLFPRTWALESDGFFSTMPVLSLSEPCMAAGLPHFSVHHMRCWGRDICISVPGLLLSTGQFEAAASLILGFGSCLKHGLIPNLLDRGLYPRYNARDATWFWLWAVQQYCQKSKEGLAFLSRRVSRRFVPPTRYRPGTPDYLNSNEDSNDEFIEATDPKVYTISCSVAELIHEILERHARGISFREWNAGPRLDHAMSNEGFDINIGTDFESTGFVYGGNKQNCGTWMDKMGDSQKAGTKGVPATPRDGSPVEIIGLLKATLRWISNELVTSKYWHFEAVELTSYRVLYSKWNEMVQESFEKHFYVPLNSSSEYANKREIYKDTLNSSIPWTDYQLRPNFCIAMVVAPELFSAEKAKRALDICLERLMGPLGIATLDKQDWAYRGTYDNSNDSSDLSIAHGHNYHQGPEWLWVAAFFLRAFLRFNGKKALHRVQSILLAHKKHLSDFQVNPYAGLPELTNENGQFCAHSCPTQAWSSALMIELVNEMFRSGL